MCAYFSLRWLCTANLYIVTAYNEFEYTLWGFSGIYFNEEPLSSGWDSSVGIASRYGLYGPGIECRWRGFLPLSRRSLGPTQPPIQWVLGPSRELSDRGVAFDHPPYLALRLTFRNPASYIWDGHTATFNTPHFLYCVNTYTYWIF
jgi:hypothetical protein